MKILVLGDTRIVKIYTLSHPRTKEIKYIGKTIKSLNNRLGGHKRYALSKLAGSDYKSDWVKSLLKQGLEPEIEILDEVLESEWQFWERHYISLYRSWGFKLTNRTKGGDGGDTFTTHPNKEKIREKFKKRPTLKGRKFSGRSNSGTWIKGHRGKTSLQWKGYVYVVNESGVLTAKYETIKEASEKLNNKGIWHIIRKNMSPKHGKFKGYKFILSKNENLDNW